MAEADQTSGKQGLGILFLGDVVSGVTQHGAKVAPSLWMQRNDGKEGRESQGGNGKRVGYYVIFPPPGDP